MANTPTLQRAPGNNASDTISGGINAADLTIPLNSASEFSNDGGKIVIDRGTTSEEYVYYESKSGNTLTVATDGRGQEGTADQSHNDGATVDAVPTADQWNNMLDAVVDEDSAQTITGAKTFSGANTHSGVATMTAPVLNKPVVNGTNPTAATYTPATGAQTVALNCAANNMHFVTGHANGTAITFTIANATNNQPFIVSILQGAVVSTITAWFDTVRWAGGSAPTLTATVGKRDTFGFIRTGAATYDGFVVGQNN